MEEGDVALPDQVVLELFGEVTEGLGPAGQENDPARLPVEAVDRLNPEPEITVDPAPEVRIILDPRLKDGAETPSSLFLDTQPRRLLYYEPALIRAQDRNGERICSHREKKGRSENSRISVLFLSDTNLKLTQATI